MEYHIGNLIKSIRKKEGISQVQLSHGLCSKSAMNKIETGEIEPGKWMADVLLERLGVSSNKYGCLFTSEEQQEFEEREKLLNLLQNGQMREFTQFWQKSWERNTFAKKKDAGGVCQKQFLQYVKILFIYKEKDLEDEQITKKILEILRWTVPDFELKQLADVLYGRVERALLVLLAYVYANNDNMREKGYQIFKKILKQLEGQIKEDAELCYQYTRITALWAKFVMKHDYYLDIRIIQKAIALLQKNRKAYGISVLFDSILKMESNQRNCIGQKNEIIQMVLQISKEFDQLWNNSFRIENIEFCLLAELVEPNFKGCMLGELLKKVRVEKGFTQNELKEKICDVKTLSRIEQGKVKPSPYIYHQLMSNLGEYKYRYFPNILSNDYELHECCDRLLALMAVYKYEEARAELSFLEQELDMEEIPNKQLVMRLRTVINGELGEITREQELEQLKSISLLTMSGNIRLKNRCLRQAEVTLLNNIANVMAQKGDLQEAQELLISIKQSCENNQIGVEQNFTQYLLTLYNLSCYYAKSESYDEAEKIIEEGLRLSYKKDDAESIVEFLYVKAWILEQRCDTGKEDDMKRKACISLYKQAFYIATFIQYDFYKEYISEHCWKKYKLKLGDKRN